jgi:hypothetical protein
MGLIYRPGPLTQIKDEIRRLQFVDFIHQGGNLDCAVAMLLVLAKGRTRCDLPMYLPEFRTETFRMLNFLCDQQLVYLLQGKRGGNHVYRAVPHAVDELVHRIEHDGEASPPFLEDGGMPQKRAMAQDKVRTALKAAGWKGSTNRLRVVR